jgi:hypothetical protein
MKRNYDIYMIGYKHTSIRISLKKIKMDWQNTMGTTTRQKFKFGFVAIGMAIVLYFLIGMPSRQGSKTNFVRLVTPVDVSDADLRCYMRRSAAASKEAKKDVNRARMLWLTSWWKKEYVVHCPRTTGTPHDLTNAEASRYLHGYLDLKKKFVNNIEAAKQHWKDIGYKEGRVIPEIPPSIENKIISIRSGMSSKFCGTAVSTHDVSCNKGSVTDTERYRVEKVGSNLMALKGYANNKYCSLVPGRGLVCNKDTVGDAEKFLYEVYGHTGLAFRSATNKRFCGDKGKGRVTCNDATPGLGEFFTWREDVPVPAPSTTAAAPARSHKDAVFDDTDPYFYFDGDTKEAAIYTLSDTSSPGQIQPSSAASSTTTATNEQSSAATSTTTPVTETSPPLSDNNVDDFATTVLETNARNNAIAAASETAMAAALNAENAAKSAAASATNAAQALKDAKAASVAATADSQRATDNLKLKMNGTLTKFETLQLDILASNASQTASKALDIVSQGESAANDAAMYATEAQNAALQAAAAHKAAVDVGVSAKSVPEPSHENAAIRAAEEAVQFAKEAETALDKARIAEQEALGHVTHMAVMQSEQNAAEQQAIVEAAKEAEEAEQVADQPPDANAANAAVEESSSLLDSLVDEIVDASSSESVDKSVDSVTTTATAVGEVTKSVATNTATAEKATVVLATAAIATNNIALKKTSKAIVDAVNVVQTANNIALASKDITVANKNLTAAGETAIAATSHAEGASRNASVAAQNATTAKTEGTSVQAQEATEASNAATEIADEAKEVAKTAMAASQQAQTVASTVLAAVASTSGSTSQQTIQPNSATVTKPKDIGDFSWRSAILNEREEEKNAKTLMEKQMAISTSADVSDTSKSKIVVSHESNQGPIIALVVGGGIVASYTFYQWKRSRK